ncbi:TetR family transcriptional regulator C-terminal domain-containing protein [Actinomadura rubrisoli]|uniref:TetR family transcriptional regulator C-terminal domain-containing protein n=1 Tax=Actinomadura rubrisoli TaxID=2530368 RepID=UPI003C7E90CF
MRPDPGGCLIAQSAFATGEQNEPVRQAIASCRRRGEANLAARFERARTESDLPSSADCAALDRYVWSVSYGLSVQAAGGVSREDLERLAGLTLVN